MSDTPQKSWQARIGEATDAVAAKFVESISYDRRIYKQDIAGSVAHATMLAKVGLITGARRDPIVAGLKSIERDIEAGTFAFDESLEDIHMVVEAALIERGRRTGPQAAHGAEPERSGDAGPARRGDTHRRKYLLGHEDPIRCLTGDLFQDLRLNQAVDVLPGRFLRDSHHFSRHADRDPRVDEQLIDQTQQKDGRSRPM